MLNFFDELQQIIMLDNANEKCLATQQLATKFKPALVTDTDTLVRPIASPGLPPQVQLVAPRQLKRRSIQSQTGRNRLMHAIAHIEFNAINLALDAAYRFRGLPVAYYQDWINIAADEARHFGLIRDYLIDNNCAYGDYPAHNGLWEMAEQTAGDVIARMALVPRVLEARGLDVTPAMITRLKAVGDQPAVAILEVIYQDEIGHVKSGSTWFSYLCRGKNIEPRATFIKLVRQHLHGELKGPFNIAARLQAGFDQQELSLMEKETKQSV